ncbi:MAG: Nudix family hydrolase [Gammaproteobacteria bacterium]|nr:Nudix family hydrolase [Gammaproteobacteria bacterium]
MNREPIQVAVGVIKNPADQVLISLRDMHLHQGGLWEFPGGKVEAGETVEQALIRELDEELAIRVLAFQPLITVNYIYPDRSVQLCVYEVTEFSGAATGCQGQAVKWVNPADLPCYDFPAANRPIIAAAQLPSYYAILDGEDESNLMINLNKILNRKVKLIQARLKKLPEYKVTRFLQQAYPLCQQHRAVLLLNSDCDSADLPVDGVHLTSRQLMTLTKRPDSVGWLAASCHNQVELQHAEAIGADFVVLAPVKSTPTHPDEKPIGWEVFADLINHINLPVYALGGLSQQDLQQARRCGAQGIAAIRAFLK